MSFREKSAWAMAAVMVLTGAFYLSIFSAIPAETPAIGQGLALLPYVLAVIVLSIVAQVILAITSPKEANQPADERERVALDRAGNWSGMVLGVAAVCGVMQYFAAGQGHVLLQWIMGGLILSQIAEYLFQIVLFRRGA